MYPLIATVYVQALIYALGLLALVRSLYNAVTHYKWTRSAQIALVDQINQLLPQTQCGQCTHKGCLPYARAIAQGEAINKCPPGGVETIRELANLLNETPLPLDPAHGQSKPISLAVIREDECIGCTKCIQACPVDAILGGAKLMHTVIARECTGCDLCVEPCPVDCIDMISIDALESDSWRLTNTRRLEPQRLDSSP